VVAQLACQLGLVQRLVGRTDHPGDERERAVALARHLRREPQHRPEEADVSDRELGGVHADGHAAGAGREVVARQGPLAALVEAPLGGQRQRVGRDDGAVEQEAVDSVGQDGHQNLPLRTPNFVGFPWVAPPSATQWPPRSTICSSVTRG
jgi:hypothetical protein